MRTLYLFGGLVALLFLSYFIGRALGDAECMVRVAAQKSDAAVAAHTEIIERERKINAETYRMGTGDIRRVLREKYTVAE